MSYISSDETYEDIHPCAFMAKLQANQLDNPTYGDILKCDSEEFKMWDSAMVTELKSLGDLG